MNKKNRYEDQLQRRSTLLFFLFSGCCILSLIIHIFLFKKIEKFNLSTFDPSSFDVIVPRRFHLESVKIDSATLEQRKDKTPQIVELSVDILPEKEGDFLMQNNPSSNNVKPTLIDDNKILEEKPESFIENDITSKISQVSNEEMLLFNSNTREDSLGDLTQDQTQHAAYSELDQLIEEKHPLSSKTSPILLPTDLLFEYNADQLKTDAEKSLKKLALLIQRNPKAEFIVEGFTDSFGSDEYNLELSARRAKTIKEWLINKEQINPNQIKSYGLGKTHFIVPSKGTIREQSLNRRVEIIIHQNKNP